MNRLRVLRAFGAPVLGACWGVGRSLGCLRRLRAFDQWWVTADRWSSRLASPMGSESSGARRGVGAAPMPPAACPPSPTTAEHRKPSRSTGRCPVTWKHSPSNSGLPIVSYPGMSSRRCAPTWSAAFSPTGFFEYDAKTAARVGSSRSPARRGASVPAAWAAAWPTPQRG